jgi:hypothetical protein
MRRLRNSRRRWQAMVALNELGASLELVTYNNAFA